MTPDWLARSIRSTFPVRRGERLRKLEEVAGRIDRRTDDMAAAVAAISEKLHA